jgi:hypothetical protein
MERVVASSGFERRWVEIVERRKERDLYEKHAITGLIFLMTTAFAIAQPSPPASASSSHTASGKATDVTMQTGAAESVLSVTLDNSKNVFVIPVSKLVSLDLFRDLKGREQMLGGLLLLQPVQQKIKAKAVVIEYTLSSKDGTNLITGLQLEGASAHAGRRFSGQVRLYNGTSEPIKSLTVRGFPAELSKADINPDSKVVLLLGESAQIPSMITVIWQSTRGDQRRQDVDLSARQQAKEDGGIIALSLKPQGGWVLEKDVF